MAVKIQNHFHLDVPGVVDSDGAPVAFYKSRERSIKPVAQTTVTTSWSGVRQRLTVVDDEGNAVLHTDIKYRVVCTSAEFATISGLLGKTVAVVDYYHPDDGEDHSSYIKTMALVAIDDITGIGQQWLRMEFTIELQELG